MRMFRSNVSLTGFMYIDVSMVKTETGALKHQVSLYECDRYTRIANDKPFASRIVGVMESDRLIERWIREWKSLREGQPGSQGAASWLSVFYTIRNYLIVG